MRGIRVGTQVVVHDHTNRENVVYHGVVVGGGSGPGGRQVYRIGVPVIGELVAFPEVVMALPEEVDTGYVLRHGGRA